MKTWVRKTLSVGVLAAGALLFGPAAAHADTTQAAAQNTGILNATQIVAPVAVPVNAVGNNILDVAGNSQAAGLGTNHLPESGKRGPKHGKGVQQVSLGNTGIGNGNQIFTKVYVPVNAVGNNVGTVLGSSNATGVGVNGHSTESGRITEGHKNGKGGKGGPTQISADNVGIANGNQIYAPVQVPINACGNNLLTIIGASKAQANCVNVVDGEDESGRQLSAKNTGILGGNQVYLPVKIPVNLSGNNAGNVGGLSTAAANSRNESAFGGPNADQLSAGNVGIANGNQIHAPITVPINLCGNNIVNVLGVSQAAASCANDTHGGMGGHNGGGHNGNGGNNGGGHHGGGHNGGNNGGNGGHHGGNPGGGLNGGDNGVDEPGDDYLGDGGVNGGDQGVDNGGDGYGKSDRAAKTEGSAVDDVASGLGQGIGGLNLLDTLG